MAKIKDLTPKFSLKPAELELELQPGQPVMGQSVGGLSMYANSFKRGYGDKVFGSDENGIWLGAADFAEAPFKVNYSGNLYTQSPDGSVVIDTVNNRIVIYDDEGVPRILIGYHEGGF